jgi:hypothetical protein
LVGSHLGVTALRAKIVLLTTLSGLFAASLMANTATYVGYVQATNGQDFNFLSSGVGGNAYNVAFSNGSALDFSYLTGGTEQTASMHFADADSFSRELGTIGLLAGTFAITNPNGSNLDGRFYVVPAVTYDFTNVGPSVLSSIVAGESVVHVSSLMPVVISPGACPYCGLMPLFSDFNDFGAFEEAPEPSTFALIGIGLAGAALFTRRRQYFKPKP